MSQLAKLAALTDDLVEAVTVTSNKVGGGVFLIDTPEK